MNQISNDIFVEICQRLSHYDILSLLTTSSQLHSRKPLVKQIISDSKDKFILNWILCKVRYRYNPKTIAKIKKFSIFDSKLQKLPREIGQLTFLRHLELSHTYLTELPTEIYQLSSLQELILTFNSLSRLSGKIGQLTALQMLYIDCNKLSELPKEIGQLKTLKQLDLSYNNLSKLPKEIGQLTSLLKLNLKYNKLSDLPKEIFNLRECTIKFCIPRYPRNE